MLGSAAVILTGRRASCALVLLAATLAPQVASADEVLRWNQIAVTAARQARLAVSDESRLLAMVHVAMHDAIAAAEGDDDPYCATRLDASGVSPEAAAAAAAHVVLSTFLRTERPALDAALADALARLPEGSARDLAVASGRQAADLVMASWTTGCGDLPRPLLVTGRSGG